MSTAEEEKLFTQAEMAADLDDLTSAVSDVLAGAQGDGVDPRAVEGLTGALRILDPGAVVSYDAGSRQDRRHGTGFGSDGEFLEAVADTEDQIDRACCHACDLQNRVTAASEQAESDLEDAQIDLAAARRALAAAYAMATKEPCKGCHGAKYAAIAEAEAAAEDAELRIRDARQRIAICEAAAEILGPLTGQLDAALERIRRVAPDTSEVYALVYAFIQRGGKLPDHARWIEAEAALG